MLKAGTKLLLVGGFCKHASSGFSEGDEVTVVDNTVSHAPNRLRIEKQSSSGKQVGFINYGEGYVILDEETIELREVLAQIDELQAKVAKMVAQKSASKKTPLSELREVEAEARKDIAELTEHMVRGSSVNNPLEAVKTHGRLKEPEFIVNERKGTVVSLLRYFYVGEIIDSRKGKAKLAPGDTFSADIGKVIALRRSLGLNVPQKYLNAGGR